MVLSKAEVTDSSERGTVKTRIGSRNVARGVGTWVIDYEIIDAPRCKTEIFGFWEVCENLDINKVLKKI